ncbi:MAG TPA: crossover junction endodeoxyribonuclease RuvC [Glycomyces sp.]|nr:crossover junction endodeoxyribonuclease RuvC [Glycomyces sp.]
MGIDPGLTRCGVGVVEGRPGAPGRMVAVDVVRTDPEAPLADRLLALDEGLRRHIEEHRPEAVAVERVFSQHNVASVIGTAQASGIALLAAARAGLPTATYTPSEAKAAVCGNGTADKRQVTAMVTRVLRLADPPKPADAADALAIAVCHLWRGGLKARLAAAEQGRPRSSAQASWRKAGPR